MFTEGLNFVNGLFQYTSTVATAIGQIANSFVTGPAQFYKLATIDKTTLAIPVTTLVSFVEVPTLQLATWYANIGNAMKTFRATFK